MKILLTLLSTLVLYLVVAVPSIAATGEFGITTGGERGTYFAIGNDIKDVAEQRNIRLNILSSQGSLENLYRVYKSPSSQLGIVQHDTLFWIRSRDSQTARRMAEKIKLIFPLYNEEVHIVARDDSGIESFDQLSGRTVAVGKEGSGTRITADTLFRLASVNPSERVAIGGAEALEKVKSSEIDAMFYVAGAPVKLFAEDVALTDNLHFVSILDKQISEYYGEPVSLDASNYPWAKDGVQTVAVKAILVTYNYRQNQRKCNYVGDIANLIRSNINQLRNNGHPKWKVVNVDARVNGWDSSDCTRSTAASGSRKTDGFDDFLEGLRQAQ